MLVGLGKIDWIVKYEENQSSIPVHNCCNGTSIHFIWYSLLFLHLVLFFILWPKAFKIITKSCYFQVHLLKLQKQNYHYQDAKRMRIAMFYAHTATFVFVVVESASVAALLLLSLETSYLRHQVWTSFYKLWCNIFEIFEQSNIIMWKIKHRVFHLWWFHHISCLPLF